MSYKYKNPDMFYVYIQKTLDILEFIKSKLSAHQ